MSTITLTGPVTKLIEKNTLSYLYTSQEDFVYDAIVLKQQIDEGIRRGEEDVKAGRYKQLTRESGAKLINDLFDKYAQT
ncbi:hypothetical protein MK079_00430 [Candidatus Gracilibacteria bacterium]|nr:hypothetical protein [Candidatus Gracilibacteria bacterium]